MLGKDSALVLKKDEEFIAQKLLEYEEAETDEEKAIRKAYEAIQEGKQVVDVMSLITRTKDEGRTSAETDLPTTAIAPPLAETVTLRVEYRKKVSRRHPVKKQVWLQTGKWRMELPVSAYSFRTLEGQSFDWAKRAYAVVVPHIPVSVRKEFDLASPERLVFFEVPAWTLVRETIKPEPPPRPVDPVLLRHLTGTLYVVEAAWDFTDLEAQIIAGVRRTT